jgi:hypothetical protein
LVVSSPVTLTPAPPTCSTERAAFSYSASLLPEQIRSRDSTDLESGGGHCAGVGHGECLKLTREPVSFLCACLGRACSVFCAHSSQSTPPDHRVFDWLFFFVHLCLAGPVRSGRTDSQSAEHGLSESPAFQFVSRSRILWTVVRIGIDSRVGSCAESIRTTTASGQQLRHRCCVLPRQQLALRTRRIGEKAFSLCLCLSLSLSFFLSLSLLLH